MKKFIALAAAVLLTVTAFAQDGKSIYRKYSDAPGVSAVYISPAMFRMMGRIPSIALEGEDVDLSAIIKALEGFYLIDSENPGINEDIMKEVNKFVKNGKYEIMMEVKDEGETVHIYTVNKGEIITNLVFIAFDKEECTFINLDGQMNQKDLDALIEKAMKD